MSLSSQGSSGPNHDAARPRLLDLFCGAGGAAIGYHRAGFEVVGVDIKPQPHYPFEFHRWDALNILQAREFHCQPLSVYFDAIHASPPCQAHTLMQAVANNAAAHPDLIDPVRHLLRQTGLPYVIENVVGAPLDNSFILCGSMFGLEVDTHLGRFQLRRHRLFETNWPWLVPGKCRHKHRVIGLYGDHARHGRLSRTVDYMGRPLPNQFTAADGLKYAREVMQMPWSDWRGIAEAIPPAYTEFIGSQLISYVREQVAA